MKKIGNTLPLMAMLTCVLAGTYVQADDCSAHFKLCKTDKIKEGLCAPKSITSKEFACKKPVTMGEKLMVETLRHEKMRPSTPPKSPKRKQK